MKKPGILNLFILSVLLFAESAALAGQQQPNPPLQAPGVTVDVIGTTPLPGVNLDRDAIAAPVQSATGSDIEKSSALDLSEFLNRRLMDVHVNEMQGNPFQPDVNYRGYTASPLLGTPQGLSVYMDGVRLNQPFGEVVSWDLIPRNAISSITLMPGSNPLFGLNTLGGALSLQTKDGRNNPGGSIQANYGSYARRALEFEYGGATTKGLSWYLAANRFGERGWRNDSHSDIRQGFGKFGWEHNANAVNLTLAWANNNLTGNGLQEQRFLDRDNASLYTKPDITGNRSAFINLTGRRNISSRLTASGNIYYRNIRTNTLNADINDDSLDQSMYQPSGAEQTALTNAGYTGFPTSGANAANTPFPFWRCIGNVLLNDEPGEKCNGLINRSHNLQHNIGAAGQFTLTGMPYGHSNQFTAGSAFDRSSAGFQQTTQLGYLNPDRSVTGANGFADGGVTGGDVDGEPFDTRVNLAGLTHTLSFYATDTVAIGNAWNFTLSGRYNRTTIENRDLINPGGGSGSLDGDHAFDRFNPAAGITYSPIKELNLYLGYSEGSRAPASLELGCADPNEPCKLPNAMAGDPPLAMVVARTWESGVRGKYSANISWNAGWFRADNRNDILFVASSQTGFGYFKNFGVTRRQGLELGVSGLLRKVHAGAGYTFLTATYESAETFGGAGNSENDAATAGLEGLIEVQPGDRIPLIPRHMAKAFIEIQATRALSFDLDMVAVSSSFARGNENNLHEPDGVLYLGSGKAAGYGIANIGAHYQLNSRIQVSAQVNNLLNHHYSTAAQLGSTGFTAAGTFIARPFPAVNGEFPVQQATFFAPGAPTILWFGTRFKF